MQTEDTIVEDIWDGALDSFVSNPAAAFLFSQLLFRFKETLKSGPEGCLWVIKAMDQGIERLYPYTDAYRDGFKLYMLAVEGNLLPKHDPTVIVRELDQGSFAQKSTLAVLFASQTEPDSQSGGPSGSLKLRTL